MNKSDKYHGNDRAVIINKLNADNDCKEPNYFIKEQLGIIGEALNEVAEHYPDLNHTIKNPRNNFYDVCTRDKCSMINTCLKIRQLIRNASAMCVYMGYAQ